MLEMMLSGTSVIEPGEFYSTSSTTFVVPDSVTRISAIAIGRGGRNGSGQNLQGANGGGGGGGGALSFSNDIPVTPGEALTIEFASSNCSLKRGSTVLVRAEYGHNGSNRTRGIGGRASVGVGDVCYSGGNGGDGGYANGYYVGGGGGGGGAAGYAGNGGNGSNGCSGWQSTSSGGNGLGGAAGGGSGGSITAIGGSRYAGLNGGSGGGVGMDGIGASGTGGPGRLANNTGLSAGIGGRGGSIGRLQSSDADGVQSTNSFGYGRVGGIYGGGSGGPSFRDEIVRASDGVVRILWGSNLGFPDNAPPPSEW